MWSLPAAALPGLGDTTTVAGDSTASDSDDSDDSDETDETDETDSDETDSDSDDSDSDDDSASSQKARYAGSGDANVFPDPPALNILGAGGGAWDDPSSAADFAVTAGDFFKSDGTIKAGGAAEVGLRALGLTRAISAQQYRESAPLRVLSRSYLSLATASSADGDDLLAGAGARVVLIDQGDPLMAVAYHDAVDAAQKACADADPTDITAYQACLTAAYKKQTVPTPAWNALGLVLSSAASMAIRDEKLSQTEGYRVGGTLSVAVPAGRSVQWGLAGGWLHGLSTPHELPTTGVVRLGVRAIRLRVESGHVLVVDDGAVSSRIPIVLGGEFRVGESVWIASRFGMDISPNQDLVTLLSSASFRWGKATEPSFKPPE